MYRSDFYASLEQGAPPRVERLEWLAAGYTASMGLDDLKKVYPDNYRLLINGLQCNVPSKIRDEKQRVGGEINALKQHAVQAPPKRGTF
jgi:hypothetical protein